MSGLSRPRKRAVTVVMLSAVLLAGCSAPASSPAPEPAVSGPVNDVDVMFLQMGLAQISEGDRVAALAVERATNPAIKKVAAELRGQWRDEGGMMERWLTTWAEPVTADPSAGAHAGHGDLHALRGSDFGELEAAQGADFDRTVVSLLLGNLHNGMATLRMESQGGSYPPARTLAATMTRTRQGQIERLLRLAA